MVFRKRRFNNRYDASPEARAAPPQNKIADAPHSGNMRGQLLVQAVDEPHASRGGDRQLQEGQDQ
jgi:hypothetical protein